MRTAETKRKTRETDIFLRLAVDKDGAFANKIDTRVGFFDHMLTALAVHSGISLEVSCKGDLEVDAHHSIEDVGIVLGQTLKQALGDAKGIARYGEARIPMDEALARCTLDISNRPYLVYEASYGADMIGDMDTQMIEEFMRAFAYNAGITLHIQSLYGNNDHHIAEALFKALAHALKRAILIVDGEVLSTKGKL